tara:strand:+ start:831 stop:1616 length:786 start_codon:yes stop_codon:yes gene_type:complete
MSFENFLQREWQDYCKVTPLAQMIHQLLSDQGEAIVNDHIALRTLSHPSIGLEAFEEFFSKFDYKVCGEYEFEDKKLKAVHFEAANKPLVFVSEFLYEDEKFSDQMATIMESLITTCADHSLLELFKLRRTWTPSFKTYEKLLQESEYAAWFYAWGFRTNHFTVSLNNFKKLSEVDQLNSFLKLNGIKLNTSGGEVKGTKEQGLMQSSTMASQFKVDFVEGGFEIPSCYYEFAKRFEKDGQIYTGFVPTSADKIFESTNRK